MHASSAWAKLQRQAGGGPRPSSVLTAIDSIGVKLFPLPHFLPASRATFYLL